MKRLSILILIVLIKLNCYAQSSVVVPFIAVEATVSTIIASVTSDSNLDVGDSSESDGDGFAGVGNNAGIDKISDILPPTISSFTAISGPVGSLVTISGTDLSNPTALTIGGVTAIAISNTGTSLVAMVMPGATTGTVVVTTAGGTATSVSNFTVTATNYPAVQQGSKLVGTGNTGGAKQGNSVSVSADGNTAIVGGSIDNSNQGAAWIYIRSGSTWTQQGNKLVGTGNTGAAYQGTSVAISADGNTAIVGGYADNSNQGAVWIYIRSGSTWAQEGNKLVGTGNVGAAAQGISVAISADGNTAIVGGVLDNSFLGASWIYTRSGSTWTQQGSKLVGTGNIGSSRQGGAVSLNADGNTAIVGGYNDNSTQGAVWIFTRTGSSWTQQGAKLVGSGNTGAANQGQSVAISADGNTAILGGYTDNTNQGAAWVFTRSAGTWTQQGSKIVGNGNAGAAQQGSSVSISADGNTALVGGSADNTNQGAVWNYTRSGSIWTQQGSKLVGTGNIGAALQGLSLSISADGNTAIVGGQGDNSNQGAVWAYTITPPPTISSFTASSGSVGTLVTITGTNLTAPTTLTIGGVTAIAISNTGTSLVAMVMPGATTGTISITTAGGTATSASNFTVTATNYPAVQQGSKLVGTGNTGAALQGFSVAISADGNTAIVGGMYDNTQQGAAWIYIRSGSTWTQQGSKLVGTGSAVGSNQGSSVAISADGNTAIVGGYNDNVSQGAAWVYTRSGNSWTQQGSKLVGTGNTGAAQQGYAVAISADGNTAIVGGYNDNVGQGAAWVYTRSGNSWTQQGNKLVGTGNTGAASQGYSVSISADGNTAVLGGVADNSVQGAVWIFTRTGNSWTQQGSKLVGTGNTGAAHQGYSVSINADGNTVIVGGSSDNANQGAAWVYTRSGSTWTQQGSKLVGTGSVGSNVSQGASVALSADGNTAIIGGYTDNTNQGAAWVYTRTGNTWTQRGSKLLGTGITGHANQGISVSISTDGNTAIVGGYADNTQQGAVWAYTITPPPTISSFTASSGAVGTLVTITGTNLTAPTALTIGGVSAIAISNTGTSLVAMVMPGATTGTVVVTTAGGTASSASNFTVTATNYPAVQQGNKLVGTGNIGAAQQGWAVAVSADGNTAIVGGMYDNSNQGAAWIYIRIGSTWTQQGTKLVGTGNIGSASQGYSVSISADGNTAIVGGSQDNSGVGAAWVFTRSGSTWTQQGAKLVGTGATGSANQGASVSLSADGNTAIVGGYSDNGIGAVWAYTRSGSSWTQQGSKLVGTGNIGSSYQGWSVAISSDGNTAIVGGFADNNYLGAAWVFARSGSTWTQQGNKLVGTGSVGSSVYQGQSVSISADGNTAIVGGYYDNNGQGAVWVYTRIGGVWTQQGTKLVGTGNLSASLGFSVSLCADGNTAIVGGYYDNGGQGATWVYTRNSSTWTQRGSKLVGTGNIGAAQQGEVVSISADGNTAIVGGYKDNTNLGAAWVYIISNTWTGTTNTDWATATNWSYGTVPVSTDAVIIPNVSNQPIIGNSTTASLNNLTINSGASLTVNGILQIGGTISNSGTFTASAGTITMNGSLAQTIAASTFADNAIQNLTINNTAGVTIGGALTVSGTVTPTLGTLTTGGYLTLASSSSGTGSIAQGTGSYLSGNVIVQRYVGSTLKWRTVGFPFTAATTIAQNTLAGFYTAGYKAYTYNEAGDNGSYGGGAVNAGWNLFTSGTITSNKGLLLSGGILSSTINFSGTINTGPQTVALSFTSGNSNKGWNLIANPFASNINWTTIKANALNTSNLDNAIYRYDPTTTAYASYVNNVNAGNQNNIIENGAGFFVHSTGATTLTIIESDKVATAPLLSLFGVQLIVAQQKSIIKLTLLKQGDTNGDEVVVRWGVDPATDNFDGNYDAYDMGRSVGPDLSVIGNDETVYSIFHGSALKPTDAEKRTVQLGIKNITEGNYEIGIQLLSAIANGNKAYLFDAYMNQYTLIDGNTNSYSFITTSDPKSQSNTRFSIVLNVKQLGDYTINSHLIVSLLNNPTTSNLFTLYSKANFNQLQWQIVDASGRSLQTGLLRDVLKGNTYQISAGTITNGNYFIKLIGDEKVLPVLKAIKN